MGKFDKARIAAADEIAELTGKATREQGVTALTDLMEFSGNNETYMETGDLEASMKRFDFLGHIMVTDLQVYEGQEGKKIIVAGHRRARAWERLGNKTIPTITIHIEDERGVEKLALLNSVLKLERNAEADPLMMFRRWRDAKERLSKCGEKDNDKAVAELLGMSKSQSDRYKYIAKTVPAIQELISSCELGMSNAVPIAKFKPAEQEEIATVLKGLLKDGEELTREYVRTICEGYQNGGVEKAAATEKPVPKTVPEQTQSDGDQDGSDCGEEYEYSGGADDGEASAPTPKEKEPKPELSVQDKATKAGEDLMSHISKIDALLDDSFDLADAGEAMAIIGGLYLRLPDELRAIAKKHKKADIYNKIIEDIYDRAKELLDYKL
ncbi:MAG: ParB/RepB/Spo0J family partition protein [Clostridiales Family XIII bacterium]|jgi:hypothetical protein|nr:ParB/RepB/Spo0J family partition protein [Clostridiales Family XIII bacterium]